MLHPSVLSRQLRCCVCVCDIFNASISHVENLRYLRVVEEVLLLVVFLELGCVVVPALLRCVRAGVGVLLGLRSDAVWRG